MGMFSRAKKSQAKLRLALMGISGGGKTFTALSVAKGLGGRVALIDTENASASKYADRFDFDTLQLKEFQPANYISAIKAAEGEGYDVIIVDSLSHSWAGPGGALDMASAAAERSKSKNSFASWKDVTPEYNKLTTAIVQSKAHVIATMRAKEEYAQEKDENGRLQVRKLGLGAISGKGIEYEFDIVLDMADGGKAIVQKSRYDKLNGRIILKPGIELGEELGRWLSDAPAEPVPSPIEKALQTQPAITLSQEYHRLETGLNTAVNGQLDVVAKEIQDSLKKGLLTETEVARLRDVYAGKRASK